jgi:hypothetical protein
MAVSENYPVKPIQQTTKNPSPVAPEMGSGVLSILSL